MTSGAVRIAIIGAVVAVITVGGTLVTVIALGHGIDSNSTPVITSILGVIGTTVTTLLALLAVVGVDKKVNGHMDRLSGIAQQAAAQTGDPHLQANADEAALIVKNAKNGKQDNGK